VNCYPFIEAEKAQRRNVKRACELLKVSRAAYCQARRTSPADGRGRTPGWLPGSRRHTRSRRAGTGRRAFTPSCAARGTGTPASGSPG
jgi:hypothetical protein